ncbi:MAG: orotate phosphoribosyltransferase [Chloroflexi bacterium]|nr:orotate phosphoribosyltransferase [Chloroflexota bacterium]
MSINIDELAATLFDIGCVKFGSFKLKSGLMSPIYLDLRLLVTHPRVLRTVGAAMAALVRVHDLQFDRLAALPYAGLPIGVAVSLELERPLIYPRKEAKDYGTAKLIEGAYAAGETVLMVDDLITRGTAKIEALKPLLDEGLVVRDILVLIDREQGGAEELAARGVALHAVMTLTQVLDALVASGRLPAAKREEVRSWVVNSR